MDNNNIEYTQKSSQTGSQPFENTLPIRNEQVNLIEDTSKISVKSTKKQISHKKARAVTAYCGYSPGWFYSSSWLQLVLLLATAPELTPA